MIAEAHAQQAIAVFAADLLGLTLLKPPGEMGADVVVGSLQRFGVPMGYGGPHAAYFATRERPTCRGLRDVFTDSQLAAVSVPLPPLQASLPTPPSSASAPPDVTNPASPELLDRVDQVLGEGQVTRAASGRAVTLP